MFKRIKLWMRDLTCCSGNNTTTNNNNSKDNYHDKNNNDNRINVINHEGKLIFYIHSDELCQNCMNKISNSRSESIK
jgi:hypothetical protein